MTTRGRLIRRETRLLFGRATSGLRALPDYLIVGAQKGGTTSLHRYLLQHPQVHKSTKKEIHYFDLNAGRGEGWYRAHFPLRAALRPGETCGEASPYYLFHPDVPARVAQLLPEVRIVALLRDPVERAYSHYAHAVKHGLEPLPTFEAAIAAEAERLAQAIPGSAAHQHHSYLARGRYAEQLERWFAHVPRERVLILRSEDFFADTAATFANVQAFLGLDHWSPGAFPTYNAIGRAPIDEGTRRDLEAAFAAPNRRLAELLEEEVWWPLPAAGEPGPAD